MSRLVAQGPYGPNNPPPPPMGPPPSKAGRKRGRGDYDEHQPRSVTQDSLTAKGPGRAFLHRKLNSRQRKKFQEAQVKSKERQSRGRSRSPTPRQPRDNQFGYCERPAMRHENDREQFQSQSPPRSARRKTLQDARRYTPDQIIDETYGRLSPPRASAGQGYNPRDQTNLQWKKRSDWPDQKPRFSRRDAVTDTFKPEGMVPQLDTSVPAWNREVCARSNAGLPEVHQQAYSIEDEVDWDNDDAFNMPIPASTLVVSNKGFKHQQSSYEGGARYSNAQETVSPSWGQQDWPEPSWEENQQRSRFQRDWVVKADSPISRAPSDNTVKGREGMGAFQRRYEPTYHDKQNGPLNKSFPESASSHSIALTPSNVPETVLDLRKYDAYVTKLHKSLPKNKAYRNGNGKAAPHNYGSMQGHDLGLCFVTFCTDGWCEMGVRCAWRHHPLTRAEREWITQIGKERSKDFLENLPRHWAAPEVPVPGANMHEKVRSM